MEKDVGANEIRGDQVEPEPARTETPAVAFPKAAKYEVTYTKANGETNYYVISNPIEEDAESFTAYVFGRGVRTFIRSRVSSFSLVS